MQAYARKPEKSLTFMLVSLTVLFCIGQIALFYVHYRVSELVDSLAASSIAGSMFNSVILFPIIQFVVIQFVAYILFILWIWFITVATGEFFKLSATVTYNVGLLFWMLGCLLLLTLNHYYFPESFFSQLITQAEILQHASNIVLIISFVILLFATVIAYINFFSRRRHLIIGSIFLLLLVSITLIKLYDFKTAFIQQPPAISQPNIIIIGLDSLRPDFTSYFGNQTINTPNIDHFLQTATTFTQAYTPLARTFPSWASILTAKYPRHSLARNNLVEPKQVFANDTLAQRLRQSGYETIYATDEKRFSNITEDYGFDRIIGPGMGVNDFILGGLNDFPLSNLLINLPGGRFLFPYNYGNRAAAVTYEPDNFLQLVNIGLANQPVKPVFLAIHLCLSHWPFTWARDGETSQFILPEKYRSSVVGVDAQLGHLLQILKNDGLLANSMVVLLSDHGTTLGLPGDRLITKKNYHGDANKIKMLSVNRFSSAPADSLDFQHDYSINTSYGQGTDLLSLKQNHVLLAFKDFRAHRPAAWVNTLASLIDVAPTIMNMLDLPAFKQIDGISLNNDISQKTTPAAPRRTFFLETGDSLSEIETDHIYIEKVVKHEIGIYQIDPKNGLLYMSPNAEASLIKNKQKGILLGDWLLVRYPAHTQMQLFSKNKNSADFTPTIIPPYYVLANIRTGEWTIGFSTLFAKKAPVKELMRQLKQFYGAEV